MGKTTFIYALCEPGTRTVRYIGKADDPAYRFKRHVRQSVNKKSHLGNWLRSLRSLGEEPNLVVLREVPNEQWGVAEERYIRLARGCGMKLVNSTDGGEGVTQTPETRKKLSAVNLGKTMPPESVEKSAAWHRGKKRSLETRAKMTASQKRVWAARKAAQV